MKTPITQISEWLQAAEQTGMRNPNAATLCTLLPDGYPDGRIVLVKHIREAGLTFFTNSHSSKGMSLATTPKATLVFHWDALGRQIRITGDVTVVETAVSDAYFAERPRESQIGAWASLQSKDLDDRATFLRKIKEFQDTFSDSPIPRPPHWQGYLVTPLRIEFWTEQPFRLHERHLYIRGEDSVWTQRLLYP